MGLARRANVHHSRSPKIAPGQTLHRRGHGGREHDGLAVLMFSRLKVGQHLLRVLSLICVWLLVADRHVLQDLLDIWLKAHVNHPICLIQNHIGTAAQYKVTVLQHINQTSWGSDDNLTAHAQPEALVFSGDAANDGHSADAQWLPKLDGLFLNLLSQLTSGGQNDGVRALV